MVAEKDIPKLGASVKTLIKRAIEKKLALDPISFGKPLRYSLKGHRRLRVGHYRIIYQIHEEKNEVLILAIGHRRDVYKE